MPHLSWIVGCIASYAGKLGLPDPGFPWVRPRPRRTETCIASLPFLVELETQRDTEDAVHSQCSGLTRIAAEPADILAHEAQHRIANSVQIIASLLQHSIRNASTTEACLEIEVAYQRISAVAELQRTLCQTNGTVELAPYLHGIGQRVGQSFLVKGGNVDIQICCDQMTLEATTATNIGLVTIELMINAIKHAFPEERRGSICVTFRQKPAGWILTVCDNGVGNSVGSRRGLGNLIVTALATQLNADFAERPTDQGTCLVLRRRDDGSCRF